MFSSINTRYISLAILSVLTAGIFSLFASPYPDGLERMALDSGFAHTVREIWQASPFPDYSLPEEEGSNLVRGGIGVFGTVISFLILMGIGPIILRKKNTS